MAKHAHCNLRMRYFTLLTHFFRIAPFLSPCNRHEQSNDYGKKKEEEQEC